MAIGMIRPKKQKLFQWLRIYIQTNVSSIILANCLLDLIFLPYFRDGNNI